MNLKILGTNNKITNEEFHYATQFFNKLLFANSIHVIEELNLEIDFDSYAPNMLAYTDVVDTHLDYPREYQIYIRASRARDMQLRSLAHEMVHMKQFALGELKFDQESGLAIWQGQFHEEVEYWDSPWEIEAEGRVPGLMYRYNAALKERNREKI
jgi:hypothetical protein